MGGEPEDVAKIAKNIAKGKVNMNLESSKNYKGLMKSVVLMTEKLTTIISNITLNAEQLELSSRQFSQSAHLISEGTYTQATSVDEITATIEQISKTSSINAENAGNTSTIATKVKDDIKKVKENTKESVKNGRIIEEKLKIVNSIATQTTILALNAAVEAARAGSQGAGFQVIATEVKRLAQVSKEAANEINELTTVNLKQTELVDKIVESIILPVEKTNQLVDSISVSSKEQQFGIMHIKTAAGNLYKISQENAASSEQMAANSTQLEEQAKELKKIISYFQVNNKAILNLKKKKKINKVIQLWKKERKYEKAII
jgi:methyl-accepting chemotaxis protein